MVADEFQRSGLVEIADGEDALEDPVEALIFPLLGARLELEEFVIGFPLNLNEIGNLDDVFDVSEITPKTLGTYMTGHIPWTPSLLPVFLKKTGIDLFLVIPAKASNPRGFREIPAFRGDDTRVLKTPQSAF